MLRTQRRADDRVDRVARISDCSIPGSAPAIDFTKGPVTFSGQIRWTGSLMSGTVKNALEPIGVRERFVMPDKATTDVLVNGISAKIIDTFPERVSRYEYTVGAGESVGIFEPRCTYRADLTRDGRSFSVDVVAGSGRWEVGIANGGGGYAGPVVS
ncbi:hypothetical protein [Tsukamurella strandjordii]|uniref:Uncharacterized protein n=1 Tax=Tsukamurella strandjordii TaxID=147577 RepID=A0AA90NBM6_9ACTN|nr:hypothetical protein [Tsukamurella strandjordii]MDP0399512.1 hypothetical protein [Tsukamurella strandjordii]